MDSLIEYTVTVLKVLGYDLFGKVESDDANKTKDAVKTANT